jgi:phosphohistidine phosphatase SixA
MKRMQKIWLLFVAGIALGALISADAPRCLANPPTLLSKDPWKGPRLVMIIRHAEKPEEKDPNLSPRGYERADALAHLIPTHFVKPDFLIATKRSSGSNRPIETITPLSKAINEPIESEFSDEEVAEVAKQVLTDPRFRGKVILIAWHHGHIPELAKSLGATDAPKEWDSKVFDRVWELTYSDNPVQFSNLPQKALPGDSPQ